MFRRRAQRLDRTTGTTGRRRPHRGIPGRRRRIPTVRRARMAWSWLAWGPAGQRFVRPRREVLNAMRALHEMPPFVREREIERGRYSHFSPEEREMLRNAER